MKQARECQIKQLSAKDIGWMRSLLHLFGEAFEEKETYSGHQPDNAYLESLLMKDHFIVLVAIISHQVVGGLAAYVAWKYIQRRRFMRELRIARITPQELKERIQTGEDVVVVDLRHSLDFGDDPSTIPGAIRVSAEQIEQDHHQIPRDREVVLFCT